MCVLHFMQVIAWQSPSRCSLWTCGKKLTWVNIWLAFTERVECCVKSVYEETFHDAHFFKLKLLFGQFDCLSLRERFIFIFSIIVIFIFALFFYCYCLLLLWFGANPIRIQTEVSPSHNSNTLWAPNFNCSTPTLLPWRRFSPRKTSKTTVSHDILRFLYLSIFKLAKWLFQIVLFMA